MNVCLFVFVELYVLLDVLHFIINDTLKKNIVFALCSGTCNATKF